MPITQLNFESYVNSIKSQIQASFTENNDPEFNHWLLLEGEMEIAQIYTDTFKTYFFGTVDERTEDILTVYGKTVIYLARTYIQIHPEYNFGTLLKFLEGFIDTQMDNFDVDLDGLINWVSDAEDYDPC
jgi:hypothetical protein